MVHLVCTTPLIRHAANSGDHCESDCVVSEDILGRETVTEKCNKLHIIIEICCVRLPLSLFLDLPLAVA